MKKIKIQFIKKISVFATAVFLSLIFVRPVFILADSVIPFSDSFDSSNTDIVTGWIDSDGRGGDAAIKTNPASERRAGSPTTGFVKLKKKTSSISQTNFSTTGYQNIHLIYYWRGNSSEVGDQLIVEWKKSSDSGYLNLATHDLNDETWSDPSENIAFPVTANNISIDIRFRLNANADNDEGLIDDVSVTGDAIPLNSILGVKFNDKNGNSLRDDGEPGLSDWTILLSGSVSASTNTDSDGNYSFTQLPDGSYTVCEVLQSGWTQTGPLSGPSCQGGSNGRIVVVANGNTAPDNDFANVLKGHIIVHKATVPEGIDQEFDFFINNDDEFTLSGGGEKTFDVIEGTYTVSEIVPLGWDLTDISCEYDGGSVGVAASPNGETVTIDAGDTVICEFTNTKRASFSLNKISDPDNGSFQFDLTGPAQTDVPAQHIFAPSGTWNLSDLLSGLYSLSETILSPVDWIGSQSIACDGNGDNDPSGSVAVSFEFTLSPGENMSCVVNNTQDAVITGKKFNDMNADGIAGDDSGIANWTITATAIQQDDFNTDDIIESGSYEAATDDGGNYILQVPPGAYHICETLQGGWLQSYPAMDTANSISCGDDTRGYELTVAAGDNISGNDFGNYQNGSISGYKWEDVNADGIFDEDALDEWTIFLDFNDNGVLDEDELYQETGDEDEGFYFFGNLAPGTYIVRESLENGWTQIFPGMNTNFKHTIVITSGEEEQDWNFGNFRNISITGFKWDDKNGDGIWQKSCEENNTGCAPESGLQNVIIALGRVSGELRQENGHETVPIEIIAMSLTGIDGGFTISDVPPGRYRLFEEKKSGWSATNPPVRSDSFFDISYDFASIGDPDFDLLRSSFFDVFAEFSGQNINQSEGSKTITGSIPSVPLEFGNHQLAIISQESSQDVASASAIITWTTNVPATSRVVYDTVSHPVLGNSSCLVPYESLNCYGYANTTTIKDIASKVLSHSVEIFGLSPDTTYYFRTISSASPENVGGEKSFTSVSNPSGDNSGGGSNGGGGGGGSGGAVLFSDISSNNNTGNNNVNTQSQNPIVNSTQNYQITQISLQLDEIILNANTLVSQVETLATNQGSGSVSGSEVIFKEPQVFATQEEPFAPVSSSVQNLTKQEPEQNLFASLLSASLYLSGPLAFLLLAILGFFGYRYIVKKED